MVVAAAFVVAAAAAAVAAAAAAKVRDKPAQTGASDGRPIPWDSSCQPAQLL
jgi:hypothetical protein